jgi:hypothetical protein
MEATPGSIPPSMIILFPSSLILAPTLSILPTKPTHGLIPCGKAVNAVNARGSAACTPSATKGGNRSGHLRASNSNPANSQFYILLIDSGAQAHDPPAFPMASSMAYRLANCLSQGSYTQVSKEGGTYNKIRTSAPVSFNGDLSGAVCLPSGMWNTL